MKLEDIIKIVEAKEQGKQRQNLLGSSSKRLGNSNRKFKKCYNCDLMEHGVSRLEKQKWCKAFRHQCSSCGKVGHFESVCRSKKLE